LNHHPVLLSLSAGDVSGNSVSSAGDVNGDGLDDLIVGAVYADSSPATPIIRRLTINNKAPCRVVCISTTICKFSAFFKVNVNVELFVVKARRGKI
jgi:hypothetical protein